MDEEKFEKYEYVILAIGIARHSSLGYTLTVLVLGRQEGHGCLVLREKRGTDIW